MFLLRTGLALLLELALAANQQPIEPAASPVDPPVGPEKRAGGAAARRDEEIGDPQRMSRSKLFTSFDVSKTSSPVATETTE
jgi:hypothetical protein